MKASTLRLGRLTDTWPEHSGSLMIDVTVFSIPEKSALDSDVRVTSSYPVRSSPSRTIRSTCSAGLSRTGRVIIPA